MTALPKGNWPSSRDKDFFTKVAQELARLEAARYVGTHWIDVPGAVVAQDVVLVRLRPEAMLAAASLPPDALNPLSEVLSRRLGSKVGYPVFNKLQKLTEIPPLQWLSGQVDPCYIGRYSKSWGASVVRELDAVLGAGSAFTVAAPGMEEEMQPELRRHIISRLMTVADGLEAQRFDPPEIGTRPDRWGLELPKSRVTKRTRQEFAEPLLERPSVEPFMDQEITESSILRLLDYPGDEVLPYLMMLAIELRSRGGQRRAVLKARQLPQPPPRLRTSMSGVTVETSMPDPEFMLKGLSRDDQKWLARLLEVLRASFRYHDPPTIRKFGGYLRNLLKKYRKQLVQAAYIIGREKGVVVRTNPRSKLITRFGSGERLEAWKDYSGVVHVVLFAAQSDLEKIARMPREAVFVVESKSRSELSERLAYLVSFYYRSRQGAKIRTEIAVFVDLLF